MNVHFQFATVSYSPDLTSVDAAAIPVAVLGIGRNESGNWFAVSTGIGVRPLTSSPLAAVFNLDPLAVRMLGDLPHLIRRYVDRAMTDQDAEATPASVLQTFSSVLRTSIHVADFSTSRSASFSDSSAVPNFLVAEAMRELAKALEKYVDALAKMERPSVMKPTRRNVLPSLDRILGTVEQLTWHPQAPPAAELRP